MPEDVPDMWCFLPVAPAIAPGKEQHRNFRIREPSGLLGDLLASVKDCPMLGFVEGIQIVRRGLSETSIESE